FSMREPLVSVIISLYNKGRLVSRAIESILSQGFQDFEIIVVDDCSTDEGPDEVRKFSDPRIRLLRTERNSGPSIARDAGIRVSAGTLIAFLDADDEWKPRFLERCLGFLRNYPEAGFVATGYEIHRKKSHIRVVVDVAEGIVNPFALWEKVSFAGTSAIMMRKEAYFETGGFDCSLAVGEDINLWVRMAMRSPVGYIPEALAIYHQEHPGRLSARWFLGKPKPWIFSEEFMPVPEEFRKNPLYESFLRLRALDAERYLRTWLSFGRFRYARGFAREHGLPFWGLLFREFPNFIRNIKSMSLSWLRSKTGGS
ncbi:MAG: glycosyltransferase family 2 protein, partial [candidate division WOR-3 bacterium]